MRQHVSTAIILGLSVVLGSSLALAQPRYNKVVQIPFSFQAQDVVLPAGTYAVTERNSAGVFELTNQNTRETIVVHASIPAAGPSSSQLVFNRYADQYFLSQIRIAGGTGRVVSQCQNEKEMAELKGLVQMSALSVRLTLADGQASGE